MDYLIILLHSSYNTLGSVARFENELIDFCNCDQGRFNILNFKKQAEAQIAQGLGLAEAKEDNSAQKLVEEALPDKISNEDMRGYTGEYITTILYLVYRAEQRAKRYMQLKVAIVASLVPMLFLLIPPPEEGVFDSVKNNTLPFDNNKCNGTNTEPFDYKIYKFFYDEECAMRTVVEDENGKDDDDYFCGAAIVNDVLGTFIGELRIEAQLFGAVSIVGLIVVLQIGGVIIPTKNNLLAIGLWAFWMLVVFFQMMCLPIAMLSEFSFILFPFSIFLSIP